MPNRPVVALDIDGTLGDYHANFLEFACLYFGEENFRNLIGLNNPGQPLWEFMGISQRDYRDAKLAYRQGGWKRWMPCYAGASTMTHNLRAAGCEVWICTTRPYLRLDNIDPDTREWLRRNGIQYDGVIWDPLHPEDGSKYHELVRQVGLERIASVVDDLPEMIREAMAAFGNRNYGIPILRDQPYNRHLQYGRRARNNEEIIRLILDDVKVWRFCNADTAVR